jgi:hypothetical protein
MSRSCAALGLSALLASVGARAAEPSREARALPIALEYSGCQALDRAELVKLLAIEFETLNVQPATPLESVRVACGRSVARVTIDAVATIHEVELAATAPAAWPRLLALSVSEIVIESRARVTPAVPKAKPDPLPASAPQPEPAPSEVRRWRLFLGASLRRAVRPKTWLAGPDFGVELDLTPHLTLAADVRVELGATRTELADVHWLSTRGALAALVGGHLGAWHGALGPGWCVGYLRLSPTVTAAHAAGHLVTGVWSGPELVARVHYELSERWFALAGIDSGIVTLPVAGLVDGQQRLVDSGGAWVSASLALGALF